MWDDDGQPGVEATDVSVADWLEVIRAEHHEMPGTRRAAPLRDCDWMADPIVAEELVVFLAIEYLKRARYHAYVAN
jgi:hypothetical protein